MALFFIGSQQDNTVINFNGNDITPRTVIKNLRVYYDLHVFEHTKMYKRVIGTSVYLNRTGDCFETKTRIKTHRKSSQTFLAKVAVGGLRKYDHAIPALKQLEWLKIIDKYAVDQCVLLFFNNK